MARKKTPVVVRRTTLVRPLTPPTRGPVPIPAGAGPAMPGMGMRMPMAPNMHPSNPMHPFHQDYKRGFMLGMLNRMRNGR